MTIKDSINFSGVQELKAKFKEQRDLLIEKGVITHSKFEAFVIKEEPDYNSEIGKKKIFDVYYGRTSSLILLWMLIEFEY